MFGNAHRHLKTCTGAFVIVLDCFKEFFYFVGIFVGDDAVGVTDPGGDVAAVALVQVEAGVGEGGGGPRGGGGGGDEQGRDEEVKGYSSWHLFGMGN